MMTTFFEGSELHGIGKMRVHRQLEDSEYLKTITVESKLPMKRGVDAAFLEISTYSNMTLWELKRLVAKFTGASPLCLTLKRGDAKKPELKDFRNCKLLSDLKFTDEEVLTLTRAPAPDVIKVDLLDKDGGVVPELKAIIASWFETFSHTLTREEVIEISRKGPAERVPTPEQAAELPETVRAMTRESCASFAEAITTLTHLTPSDHRVTGLFDKYSRSLGNGHLLLEPELQAFYADQAATKPDVVRQNLHHQGIGNDLKPYLDWSSLTLETDSRIV
jgi:hypothetical protein